MEEGLCDSEISAVLGAGCDDKVRAERAKETKMEVHLGVQTCRFEVMV